LKQDNSSGYVALRHGAAVVALPFARLLMRGADRRAYLQGILTNDIAALTPGTGCYAAMLTAQGRMIADVRVVELGEALLVGVPRELAGALRDHFERFVFAEDVQVEDVTAARAEIGLYGPRALDVLQAAGTEGGAPATLHEASRVRLAGQEAILIRSDRPGVRGFDVVIDTPDAAAVEAAFLRGGATRAGTADVDAVRVESGMPWFGLDMDTETIPLEAGLEDRAISRSKGCYVGQEVIVRVQDRGHGRVARRLVGLTFDAAAPVMRSGAAVRSADREVGRVTSAVWSPALSRPAALAYVHRDFAEPGTHVSVEGCDAVVSGLPLVRIAG
jgi:folate-binding protein YgfZ